MADVSAEVDMACDALQSQVEQIFVNMKNATPALEDLLRAAGKYQTAMEEANKAAGVFIDALGKVAVAASRSQGATAELGSAMQKVVARHHGLAAEREAQAHAMEDQFIIPLQRRLKVDTRNIPKQEEDFKSSIKLLRSELKKAGQNTVKAQKQARKGNDDAMDQAVQSLQQKSRTFEAFVQRCLKQAFIDERRRFCYLMENYATLFLSDFYKETDHQLFNEMLILAQDPEELPAACEAMIAAKSSNGLLLDNAPPQQQPQGISAIAPSPLTRELQNRQREEQMLPPGCPPGGLTREFDYAESQLNPRSARPSGVARGSVPIDVVLANQKATLVTPVRPGPSNILRKPSNA